jgi:hypothetical protein
VRILLDECVHAGVRAAFAGHAVKTVTEAGWRGSEDGSLLSAAERSFDVFVTIDRRLERQYNLATYRLGFVIVRVPSNMLSAFEPIFDQLREAADRVRPGEIVHVSAVRSRPN